MKNLTLHYPVKPWQVTQSFGGNGEWYRKNGINIKGHNGIDAVAPNGTPVRASHDGEVTFTGEDGSGGLGVVIRTNERFTYEGKQKYFKTIYWHLLPNSFAVKPGQMVKAGQLIGLADNTGFSTGSHLHFSLKPIESGEPKGVWYNVKQDNGYMGAIDPTPFFSGVHAQDVLYKSLLEQLIDVYKKLKISRGKPH